MNAALGNARPRSSTRSQSKPSRSSSSPRCRRRGRHARRPRRSAPILGGNRSRRRRISARGRRRPRPNRRPVGLHGDETSLHCHWHLPGARYLEAAGRRAGLDGAATLIQPLIAPLYGGRAATEVWRARVGERSAYDILRATWRGGRRRGRFEACGSRRCTTASCRNGGRARSRARTGHGRARRGGRHGFVPSGSYVAQPFHERRLAQGCHDRSRLVWDNAALVAPAGGGATVANGDVVSWLAGAPRTPVWIVPGHARSITLHLGWANPCRTRRGGTGIGDLPPASPRRRRCAGVTSVRPAHLSLRRQDHH
jgi:hypothetical protein